MAKAKSGDGKVILNMEELERIFLMHGTDEDRLDAIVELAVGDKGKAQHITAGWRHSRKTLEHEAETLHSEIVENLIVMHKADYEKEAQQQWPHGNATQSHTDENGITYIRYEDGEEYRYSADGEILLAKGQLL